jgi:hypothetical protein
VHHELQGCITGASAAAGDAKAQVSTQLVLCFIAGKVLGLPKSC